MFQLPAQSLIGSPGPSRWLWQQNIKKEKISPIIRNDSTIFLSLLYLDSNGVYIRQEAEYSFSGFIPTNKQTNKQTKQGLPLFFLANMPKSSTKSQTTNKPT